MKYLLIPGIMSLVILLSISCDTDTAKPATLTEVASSQKLWTGVAVSHEGRIFVNYPRWSPGVDISVAELVSPDSAVPYPDQQWNSWSPESSPENSLVCVQSVYIDKNNFLWILDPANPFFQGVIPGGAKLLKVDLKTNQVIQKYFFNIGISPRGSYLNDIRVDTDRNIGYMTDSGLGAIIVIDFDTGKSRRLLNTHPSAKAEDITLTIEEQSLNLKVHSDGLALDPQDEYLYYQALTGRNLYRIRTEFLRNQEMKPDELAEKVEWVIESGASDAIEFDSKGNLYLTSIEMNAIRKYTPAGNIETVVADERLKWPDSFSILPNGAVYVTTSQLHLGSNPPDPYKIYKISQ
jgi:hypothetical protein